MIEQIDIAQPPDPARAALVVDTEALPLVQKVLEGPGLALSVASSTPGHPALGLTRVTLDDANAQPLDDLDGLLAELRRRLAAQQGGWVPPIGKEREASSSLARGGNPKPTSTLQPQPVDADEPIAPLDDAPPPNDARTVRIGQVDTPAIDLQNPPADLQAWQAHATFVTAIVNQQAPAARVLLCGVLDTDARGSGWRVANAIARLAVDEQVDIVLLPLACFTADGEPPLLMQRAIAAVPDGTLVIAAAGNQTFDPGWSALGRGPRSPAWPAALPAVAAVGVDPQLVEPTDPPGTAQPWVDALTDQVDFVGPFITGNLPAGESGQPFTGRARWRGVRPISRGIARNPVDHPNGGRTNGGKHWSTPWGKPTKGYKTRTNKRTTKLIVRSRHKAKKSQ